MVGDRSFTNEERVWGMEPSELGLFASSTLKQGHQFQKEIYILDLGCGYGRDALYLARNLKCHVQGIDNSEKSIALARESVPNELADRIEFLLFDFSAAADRYDVVFISNLYQLLKTDARAKLRETVRRCLNTDGWLFLSTLSVSDRECGRGKPVENEENSFQDKRFLHFCNRKELEDDFDFLNITALFEREYRERHSNGTTHEHISWILLGSLK